MEYNEMNIMHLMGLHCLKCGSHDSLRLFEHTEIITKTHKRYYSKRNLSIKVPLCRVCNSELEAWKGKHGVERTAYSEVISYFCCGSFAGVVLIQYIPLFSLIIFPLLGLGALHIFRKRRLKAQLDSPFRYVKFIGNEAFVNPKGKGNWIKYKNWLNRII